uniref:Sulfur carrier protein FdhD n=1 Tax=Candidatus Methanogaster sp. ANME-2c ERB4 TaxID=2759911 RepID=A0A7G9YHF1_9EURY|nr:sulfur carrier protein FdhD [Methanosarcinales archaeon ANME-2c ERB4]
MGMNVREFQTVRVSRYESEIAETTDCVVCEEFFRIHLNDEFVVELGASPRQLEELGAGYIVCKGLAHDIEDVRVSGDEIYVYAETSSIIKRSLPEYSIVIGKEDVFEIMNSLRSEIWDKTGGTHCSVLFSEGLLVARSDDVARRNTVDKVVGSAISNEIDLATCAIGSTGRESAGMISKAENAGIPIVISRSAPTDKGILAADRAGITLICFARDKRFTIYAHPYRID